MESVMKAPPSKNHAKTADADIDPARWAAVLARDPAADTQFVYAVKTTGVYCRPSSLARLPKRENVEFFDTPEAAEAAGYRPSRRASVNQSEVAARHAALAARLGMSAYHFHRLFKAETGLTPKTYAEAFRARRMRSGLDNPSSATITDAIYDAGFNANSRFYETADARLGMPPGDYRAGGRNASIRFAIGETSLGAILVAQSQRGICAILLGDDPDRLLRDLQDKFPRAQLIGGDRDFEKLIAQVVGLVEAPALGLNLPLDIRGTAFQERVWQALREIPAGATASYADIAERIGSPKAVRAVAQACGANAIAIAIPCHRVVRKDGDLAGYRWGVERKRELLKRENS